MAFSLVWSLGYIISLIIFSSIIAMIFNFNETSNKTLAKYIVISVISISLIVYFVSLFKNQLFSLIGSYNYTFLFLMAFILIFIGYLLSQKKNFKNSFKKVVYLSYLCFLLVAFVCILSKSALCGFDGLQLSLFTTLLFNILIVAVFFIVKNFDLKINRNFKILTELYFVFGLYFLIVSLFLPNIVSLDMNDMKPIEIVSIDYIIFTIVLLIVVTVLGLLYYKKNTLLK